MSTAEFNPTVIYNLIVGANRQASNRKVGPILTSVRTDLRSEIERALPVFYLYDAEVIVDTMLEYINPYTLDSNRGAIDLSKFISRANSDTGGGNFPVVSYAADPKNKSKKVEVIKDKGDDDALSSYIVLYNKLVTDRNTIIDKVHTAIENTASKTIEITCLLNSITEIKTGLFNSIQELTSLGSAVGPGTFTRVIRSAGRAIKKLSGNSVVVKISDPQNFIDSYNPRIHTVLFANSFENAKKFANKGITDTLITYLEKVGISVNKSNFYAGSFTNAGHVGYSSGGTTGIATPLLQSANAILAVASRDDDGIINRFINNTDHSKWLIEVSKEHTSGISNAISLGISLVRSQPAKFNSGVLSVQETGAIDAELKNILNTGYRAALENIKASLQSNPALYNYLTNVYRQSPTFMEAVVDQIVESLRTGSKTSKNVSKSKSGNFIPDITKVSPGSEGLKKVRISKSTKTPTKVSVQPRPQQSTNNLSNLLAILRARINAQVEQNMGTGSSTSVLNYRSGRFANSVTIDRLSQSREGMISVYYNYMRNPYGTFSEGGAQQVPKTRDPKTLISKSIREIGAAAMYSKMRAVLV